MPKMTRIWSPADAKALREAMARHPGFAGRDLAEGIEADRTGERDEVADVIDLDSRR